MICTSSGEAGLAGDAPMTRGSCEVGFPHPGVFAEFVA